MVINNDKEKVAVFTRYFRRLYNPPVNADQDLLREFDARTESEQDTVPISEIEVEEALKAMKNRKAAGICEIPPELLKQGGPRMVGEITRMFNVFLEEQRVPADWKKGDNCTII